MTEYAKLVLAVDSTDAKSAKGDLDTLTESGRKAESGFSGLKDKAALAGAAIAAAATAVVAMTKASIDAADAAIDNAQAAGTTTENYTRMAYAMRFGANGAADLDGSMKFLNKSMFDAANGSAQASMAFDRLGIAYTNTDGSLRDSTEVMLDVAGKFSTMKDGAEKSALAMDIFGRSGAEIIPFLNQGREGISALTDQADRLGVTLSGDVANAAGQFNDNIEILKGAAQGFGNQVMKGLLPALNNLGNEMVATADNGDQMASAADGVVAILKGVVSVAVTVSAALQGIGNAIGGIAAATVAAISGDFKGAAQIMSELHTDTVNLTSNTMSKIAAIWDANATAVETAEARKREAVHATMMATGTGAAPSGAGAAATAAAPVAPMGPTDEEIFALLEREGEAQAQVNAMREWFRQQDIQAEQAASEQRIMLAQAESQARKSAMDGMFSNLISLMSSRSKTMFNIGKAAAITQTVLSTYEGAQKAYSALAGIPIVGPALGIAAAGAAIAAGAARVSAIRSQSFGGGGSVSNVGGGGGVSAGGGFSGSTAGGGLVQQQAPKQQTTDIRLTGIRPDDMITGSYLMKIIEGIGETLADNGGRMGKVELVTA